MTSYCDEVSARDLKVKLGKREYAVDIAEKLSESTRRNPKPQVFRACANSRYQAVFPRLVGTMFV